MKRAGFVSMVVLVSSLTFPNSASASTTYAFTAAGLTGEAGPTQAQINSAYSGTSLARQVSVTGGVQFWTAPPGKYRIAVYGSSRGDNANGVASGTANGFGAIQIGEFTFATSTTLKILVGQPASADVSGNSGFFVATNTNTALIVAGGAGGDGPYPTSWRGFQGSTSAGNGTGGAGTTY